MDNLNLFKINIKENHSVSAWRFELKYIINYFQYHKIRIALLPYMKKDYYTMQAPDQKYFVRTLYYDTYDYDAYHEKMSGDYDRIKFRIRTYSRVFKKNAIVRVELKVRKGNTMEKFTSFVTGKDYLFFMKNKIWEEENNPVLNEFIRYMHMRDLKPQILIEYLREGYEDRAKKDLRITFDHNVKSAQDNVLFPDSKVFFRYHLPHTVVLEIKCKNDKPVWLTNLVRNYGLRLIANSKFTQGIQAARHDLYHPDGVVLIR